MDNLNVNAEPDPKGTPSDAKQNNRTFLIAAGTLGSIAVLALICIAVYGMVLVPYNRRQQVNQVSTREAANALVALSVNQTRDAAAAATFTPTVTPINQPTYTPSPTAVVVIATRTPVAVAQTDPRTATVAALLTQAAAATRTVVPTSTALPQTGFADEVGLPLTFGLALTLIGVIFVTRRLRAAI